MKIGEKIKSVRSSKMMTQAELAGDGITRNMLSKIENGTALPSLPTLLYIASRLNIPAGYLIAEDDNEFIYKKINCIDNIKRAFTGGEFELCRSICLNELSCIDDETAYILSECLLGIAKEKFEEGRLFAARGFFDEALDYSLKTVYNTDHIKSQIDVYLRYMTNNISHSMYSGEKDIAVVSDMMAFSDGFCRYIIACESITRGNMLIVSEIKETFSDELAFFRMCIDAHLSMANGDYLSAKGLFEKILESDAAVAVPLIYDITCALEICCRETNDYKGAYDFSNDKLRLLEKMLSANAVT